MSLLNQQMAERRERILENARSIIGERGYEGLTMRDLARASQVTVPTIYNLIGSKEQVLLAAVEEQTGRFIGGLDQRGGDVVSIIDAGVRELLRMPHYYRALLMLLLSSDSAQPARRNVGRALGEQIDGALAQLDGDGDLAAWADRQVLRDRIQSHFEMTSLQWARGWLSAAAFRANARFEAAALLVAVTSGARRQEFENVARESQSGTRPRGGRTRAAAEEASG